MRRFQQSTAHRVARVARVATALGTSLTLVSLAACGQATPSGPARAGTAVGDRGAGSSGGTHAAQSSAASGQVRLRATLGTGIPKAPAGSAKPAVQGLAVDYTLTNAGPADLVAYDVVPVGLGSAVLPADADPEHAWVVMHGGVVRLTKQGFALAPGVRFMAAPVVGVRALAPGGAVNGRAWAPNPPRASVPGDSFDAPRGALDPAAKTWQFCVQLVPRPAGTRPAPSHPGVLVAAVAAPEPNQLVCTEPAPLPAP
jgi:hypothetical protein